METQPSTPSLSFTETLVRAGVSSRKFLPSAYASLPARNKRTNHTPTRLAWASVRTNHPPTRLAWVGVLEGLRKLLAKLTPISGLCHGRVVRLRPRAQNPTVACAFPRCGSGCAAPLSTPTRGYLGSRQPHPEYRSARRQSHHNSSRPVGGSPT